MTEKDIAAARREISKLLKPYLEKNRRLRTKTLEQAITKLERSIRDELTRQLKREQQSWRKKADQLSQEQASERAKARLRPLRQLNQLQKQVEQLAEAIVAQQEAATVGG